MPIIIPTPIPAQLAPAPTPAQEADYAVWRAYKKGGLDECERTITEIYAKGRNYVIYFANDELYYECVEELLGNMGSMDAALAKINRLLPAPKQEELRQYDRCEKMLTLELAADAFEIWFCGHRAEAQEIIESVVEKLHGNIEGKRRLYYQLGAVIAAAILWAVYLNAHDKYPMGWSEPWMLAAALGAAGGTLSVCMNLAKITVNVNHRWYFLFTAGLTRSVIALLGGIVCLLAIRAKVLLGVLVEGKTLESNTPLFLVEMFFCFVAGFSETFVPNVLGKAEQDATPAKPAPADPVQPVVPVAAVAPVTNGGAGAGGGGAGDGGAGGSSSSSSSSESSSSSGQ